jgi:rhodanese-related sulfurtransferase
MNGIRISWLVIPALLATTACTESTQGVDAAALEAVAQHIARGDDRVAAEDLAKWVVEERADITIIDVRPADQFAAGSIKGATNVVLTELLTPNAMSALPHGKKLILYSNATDRAAQAAVALRLAGFDAYALTGGFDHWVRRNIQQEGDVDPELLSDARRQAIARALNQCPPLPVAEIQPPGHVEAAAGYTPPVAPATPAQPAGSTGAVILEGGC